MISIQRYNSKATCMMTIANAWANIPAMLDVVWAQSHFYSSRGIADDAKPFFSKILVNIKSSQQMYRLLRRSSGRGTNFSSTLLWVLRCIRNGHSSSTREKKQQTYQFFFAIRTFLHLNAITMPQRALCDLAVFNCWHKRKSTCLQGFSTWYIVALCKMQCAGLRCYGGSNLVRSAKMICATVIIPALCFIVFRG